MNWRVNLKVIPRASAVQTLSEHLATRTLACLHVWRLISCPFDKNIIARTSPGPEKQHLHLLGNSRSTFEIYRGNFSSICNSITTSFKILRNHSWQKCQEVCSMSHATVTRAVGRRTILKSSLKESSFVLKFPILHLYSSNQFSTF